MNFKYRKKDEWFEVGLQWDDHEDRESEWLGGVETSYKKRTLWINSESKKLGN